MKQLMERAEKGLGTDGKAMTAATDGRSWHHMGRRADAHDYSRTGIYHITIHTNESMGQPLGAVVGSDADSAAVSLTPVGEAVLHELLTAITAHYPMITVDTYVIMPEHLHFILNVRDPIITKGGRPTHLGQVIAGFKEGCNRAFWAATGQGAPAPSPQDTLSAAAATTAPAGAATPATSTPAAKPLDTLPATGATTAPAAKAAPTTGTPAAKPLDILPATGAKSVAGGSAVGNPGAPASNTGAPISTPSAPIGAPGAPTPKPRYSTGRPVLFAPGYCDVMPIEEGQLETQRAYILNNPRSRWLRSHDRARLQAQRGGIDTALTPSALRGYLQSECPRSLATPDALAAIEARLLMTTDANTAGSPDSRTSGCGTDAKTTGSPRLLITCDSYGDRALLQRVLLPVVCHRRDASRFAEQKTRCLEEAARGAVLVSACISPKEREIIGEAAHRGFATIIIADNGFPERYHPSAERIDACADGRLLLVTPWQYEYRGKNDPITVPFCKTMNCVAQALCRTKDSWWTTDLNTNDHE